MEQETYLCRACEKARKLIAEYKEKKDATKKEILKNREKRREPVEGEVS